MSATTVASHLHGAVVNDHDHDRVKVKIKVKRNVNVNVDGDAAPEEADQGWLIAVVGDGAGGVEWHIVCFVVE